MHSFFVRPGTASAIRSHLSGVLAGYVRRAFSKSWKRKKQKNNRYRYLKHKPELSSREKLTSVNLRRLHL